MGTKQNPNPNDCYERAEMDEPLFTLLARDPLAPGCVRLWAALRAGDLSRAKSIFANLMVTAGKVPYQPGKQTEHVVEARECANAMELWHIAKNPKRLNARQVLSEALDVEPEEESAEA